MSTDWPQTLRILIVYPPLESNKVFCRRVLTLGIVRKLQTHSGIGAALYMETFRRGTAIGFNAGDFSWTLESNTLINRGMKLLGAKLYKRYRFYERGL